MKTATLFGIKNCDTVKKARRWLDAKNIQYNFVDFKQRPPEFDEIQAWLDALGVDKVINKRSTTWKALSDEDKSLLEGDGIFSLIRANPTLVKRPVLAFDDKHYVGFSDSHYAEVFGL